MAQLLEVGFGEVDITPTPPREDPEAFKVFDPIGFRAVALRQGEEHVVFVSGDFFSFEDNLTATMREALADIDWLNPKHVVASVSHIGGSPILFPSYVNQPCKYLRSFGEERRFALAAAEAARKAINDLRPTRIGFNVVPCRGVHYNRRSHGEDGKLVMSNFMLPYPRPHLTYGPVDENVYVMRFDELDEEFLPRPRGATVVFGCHALCNSDKLGHISGDFPWYLRQVIENAWGVPTVFMEGALGNVVPFHRAGRTYQSVGNAVGGAALYALEQTSTRGEVDMAVTTRTIRVPTFAPESEQAAQERMAASKEGADGAARMHLYAARQATASREIDYTMTAARIGDALLLHLPGEIFVETAAAIRAASPLRPTVIISAPSADVGYLCPPEAHAEGGMEPNYTAVAAEAETRIRQAASELVAAMAGVHS